MVIINDVFSPNCICTYQEKNHTSTSYILGFHLFYAWYK